MKAPFDIKFIRLDQEHVGLARQASPFLRCFWTRLIKLILKDTDMVFSISGMDTDISSSSVWEVVLIVNL